MAFPTHRPRRLRHNPLVRQLVRETRLSREHLIQPLFVCAGNNRSEVIEAMPGQQRFSVDRLAAEAEAIQKSGIPGVILFGVPDAEKKDAEGSEAWRQDGIVQQAIQTIKATVPELLVIGDVCLCQFTEHGHCGVLHNQTIENDRSLEFLARTALSQAAAGADIIAPSDMMDGRVAAIRHSLDENGFNHLPIMSYAAKYASSFYGPFREAAQGTPQFGDRKSYQMDPANEREALKELELDFEEGADLLLVKPALPYLDIIAQAKTNFPVPIAAYQVSGEYAMMKAAIEKGWLDEGVILESLTAIKRAGADLIVTYFAKTVAPQLPQ